MFTDMENDVAENWCEATSTYGAAGNYGTPGDPNILCESTPDGDAEAELVEDEADAEEIAHASVFDIQNPAAENHPAPGSLVSVGPVTVSSEVFDFGGSYRAFFVTEPAGGYFSGMAFVLSKKSRAIYSPGDSVTCSGFYEEYCDIPGCSHSNSVLRVSDCTNHSSGNNLPAPVVVASASPVATGGYLNDALQGVLISLENVVVTEEMDANGEWLVDDTLIIDDVFGYSYTPQLNENIVTLTGFLHTSGNEYKLEPRDNGDIELEQGSCVDDAYEPNETRDAAPTISGGNFNELSLCEGDSDWYAFSLSSGDSVKIDIYFHHSTGDLNLYLHSSASQLAASESATDDEHISYTATADGTYYIQISAVSEAVNSYDMSLSINGSEGFTPGGVLPGAGDLVITEFLADASGSTDSTAQWFEIYNISTTTTYNLEGMRIRNGDGSVEHEIINGGTLNVMPGQYKLFAISDDTALNGNIAPDYTYTGLVMQPSDDGLELYNPFSAEVIDEVSWSESAAWYIFEGFAMNLDPVMFDADSNDISDNWCYASFVYGGSNFGTPGAANKSCGIAPDGDTDSGDTEITYEWPVPGEVVITEFMKNPAVLSDADGEWFEIYNADPNAAHEIGGCRIADSDGEMHEISGSLVLNPGEFAVFTRNGDSASNGGITPDYAYGDDITLDDDSDEIVLVCDNVEVDRLNYTDSFGDTEGAASMLDPRFLDATLNNYASYWCIPSSQYDALNHNYGTPGAVNDHNCY